MMTYEEALRLVLQGKYAEADVLIIDALENQIAQKPLDIVTTDNEYITTICPYCHQAIDGWDEIYNNPEGELK